MAVRNQKDRSVRKVTRAPIAKSSRAAKKPARAANPIKPRRRGQTHTASPVAAVPATAPALVPVDRSAMRRALAGGGAQVASRPPRQPMQPPQPSRETRAARRAPKAAAAPVEREAPAVIASPKTMLGKVQRLQELFVERSFAHDEEFVQLLDEVEALAKKAK